MNKNLSHYILTFLLAFGVSFATGKVYAQLFENPDAMKAAYQQAAAQGQDAVNELLKNASQNGRPQGENGEKSEYEELIALIDQDKADGRQDGNFSPPADPNAPPAPPPEKIKVYNLNEYEIITDANGNVTGIKKKEKEKKEGEDEDGEEGEGGDQGGGAPGGGGQDGAPPRAGDGFKESENPKEEYSSWCWNCVQPGQCKTGALGACDLKPCKEDETCADHVEKMADGKEIICHVCTPPPPPPPLVCEEKGFMSDPKCNGACPPDLCERVMIAPDGKIRTWTALRSDLTCYRCGEAPKCKVLGYYVTPDCEGKCPADMCAAVYINPKGGLYGPGQTMPKDTPKCYRCKNQEDQEQPPECTRGVTDPLCQKMCSPQQCKVVDTIDWNGHVWSCYDCDESASVCAEKGFYDTASCDGKCEQGSICVPLPLLAPDGHIWGPMETRVRGEGLQCYGCMKIKTIEITWYIIIIEYPWGRVVLDNFINPTALTGFTPQSVMAMMTPDNPAIKNIEKLAALSGGKMTAMKAQDLVSMLTDALSKKRKFSNDCFSDLKPQDVPKEAPKVAEEKPKKKKGEPEPESPNDEFGNDPMHEAVLDGPVVACGKKGEEDVLVVYDAYGGNPQVITKEELKSNPDKFLEMMVKADAAYKAAMSFKDMTPQSALKIVAHKLVDKIMALRKPKEKKEEKKKKPAADLTPNDPLYWPDYGVKKSKVTERLSKVAGSFASGGQKGGAFGGGEDPVRAAKEKGGAINDQWGIREIGYLPQSDPDSAWNAVGLDFTQPNVLVAVIDSGFDYSHPDGPKYIWTNDKEVPDNGIDDDLNGYADDVNGWNFIDNNTDMRDFHGHGTFVAGIIAAQWNNGEGIAGINPGAVIMPLRVADEKGEANSLNIFRAINYAINQGAKIINISLGNRGISQLEQSAINRVRDWGVFVAVASGNFRENIADFGPAASKGVFAVGSMDRDGKKSTISNWGPNNGLIAPGEEIYSLRSVDSYDKRKVSSQTEFYYKMSGTSFSSPMAAATASLILAKNPSLTAKEIEDILHNTAKDLYDNGWDGESGAGLLDAAAALRATPQGLSTLKITGMTMNRGEDGEVESVDVYATVRGNIQSFTVGVGKGSRSQSFDKVAGPFNQTAENQWVTRIDAKHLRGSNDWVVALEAVTQDGKNLTARTVLILKQEDVHDY